MSGVALVEYQLDLTPSALATAAARLDPAERRRAARFVQAGDRDRFVARRAALRCVLAATLGRPESSLEWELEPGGRPRLAGHELAFSASCSGDLLVIALADEGPVGVDVERLRALPDLDGLAAVALSPREWRLWDALPRTRRHQAFLEAWTTKEAFLKAHGWGLARAPETVIATGTTVRLDDEGPTWPVRRLRRPDHVISVVAGPAWDRRLEWRPAHAFRTENERVISAACPRSVV